jgi:hypothetical protein
MADQPEVFMFRFELDGEARTQEATREEQPPASSGSTAPPPGNGGDGEAAEEAAENARVEAGE